jgi:hypothetical protein
MSLIIRLILARLGLGEQPTQVELQELWQWVPIFFVDRDL